MNFFDASWRQKAEKINAYSAYACALRGFAYLAAAIVIGTIVAGLEPVSASSYEPPLSILNVTTVDIDHGPLGNPPDGCCWDMEWPQPGEQSRLSAFVVNNGDQAVSYVLVFQVRYTNNVTQIVVWQETELGASESKVVDVLWMSDHSGYFEIDILAVSDLEKPASLSDAALYQTYSIPVDSGRMADYLPDLLLSSGQENQIGILGTFSYVVTGDAGILVPKNSTVISSGDTIAFELADTNTWFLKETSVQYYRVDGDFQLGREFDDYYEPATFPQSFDFLESGSESEYVVDLLKGDYVFQVYTTFQYKMGDMLLDEGNGNYFFRATVD